MKNTGRYHKNNQEHVENFPKLAPPPPFGNISLILPIFLNHIGLLITPCLGKFATFFVFFMTRASLTGKFSSALTLWHTIWEHQKCDLGSKPDIRSHCNFVGKECSGKSQVDPHLLYGWKKHSSPSSPVFISNFVASSMNSHKHSSPL